MKQFTAQVVVVTGLSGAGKSTALGTLADLGYYCVDNLPPPLVGETVRVCSTAGVLPVALGLDVRVGAFLDTALRAIEALDGEVDELAVLFLDAADEVLVRRYSETRRPHPMLSSGVIRDPADGRLGDAQLAVLDAVRLERERLAAIRLRATLTLDTTHMSVHELRRQVMAAHGPEGPRAPRMVTRLLSFGFKYGAPLDADLVFDVRFLDNPFFVQELRDQRGTDEAVRAFVLASPGCAELVGPLEGLLRFALPRYEKEGKSYLTVGIGCTGGRHRSVALTVRLAELLRGNTDHRIGIVHRDLDRGGMMTEPPSSGALRGG